jgi:hypothetical protein
MEIKFAYILFLHPLGVNWSPLSLTLFAAFENCHMVIINLGACTAVLASEFLASCLALGILALPAHWMMVFIGMLA